MESLRTSSRDEYPPAKLIKYTVKDLADRGEDVAFVVPVELRARRRQEIEGVKYGESPARIMDRGITLRCGRIGERSSPFNHELVFLHGVPTRFQQ